MAVPRPATTTKLNRPPSNRVNYGDHYLLSAIRAEINKIGGVTTVNAQINNQNKRGIIEKNKLSVGLF